MAGSLAPVDDIDPHQHPFAQQPADRIPRQRIAPALCGIEISETSSALNHLDLAGIDPGMALHVVHQAIPERRQQKPNRSRKPEALLPSSP